MERMRLELEAEGYDFHLVAINATSAIEDQDKLIERGTFALLQDIDEVQAWSVHHRGVKDDFIIYDEDGKLVDYLAVGDMDRSTNLGNEDGYANVKNAIIAAFD